MEADSSRKAFAAAKAAPTWKRIRKHYQLYVFLLPTIVYFLVFQYGPMYGLTIAFKQFVAVKGIAGSPWVGFAHFERFFHSFQFATVLRNTLLISLYELLVAFPLPIVLALLLNQVGHARFKKLVQTVTYAPHFISAVVIVGMLYLLLSPRSGLVNRLIVLLGGEPVYFMASADWFKTIFVFSGVWQNAGWSMIVYLAALTAVNPDLHEAAVMDGASKARRIWHIDVPAVLPTIMIMFILNVGSFMSVGFEKIYLMQNPLNLASSEVIQTYVYKTGLLGAQYSYSAAVGLFNSLVNFVLLLAFNRLAKSLKQASLW
ncbi:ABC transporter permease [Paenibacillus flagellatus]|uniref:Sugar ABC transporter permease n=1 Tax=Paenibacillus flagellatus TaxID=2211139 RepID=A0A2V5JX41_9BACL|nr:ABC transporter permease subunit [Paenibacillus flagellatus]PYI50782.1 sugar ABC transporter permease [Paenibacillus flagellatus]